LALAPGGAGVGGSEPRGAASSGHGVDDYLLGARRPFGAGEVEEGTDWWSFLFYFYKWFFCRYSDNLFFISFKRDLEFFIRLTWRATIHRSK
jgi:hypothetical protein